MTVPTCATGCGRPSADAFLCRGCTARLTRAYAELPSQLADLEVTLTRQSKAGRGDSKATKKAEQPLPFDFATDEVADEVRNALTTQIRHICESRKLDLPSFKQQHDGTARPARGPIHSDCEHGSCVTMRRERRPAMVTMQAMAQWLLAAVPAIRQDEAAADLYSGTLSIVAKLRSAVDNHEKRFAGPCTATIHAATISAATDASTREEGIVITPETRVCGADLRLRHNAPTITCRECGAEYDTIKHLQGLLTSMTEKMALISYIDAMISAAGYVRPGTVAKWLQRDEKRQELEDEHARQTGSAAADVREFFSWREDDMGRPLWRLGDFLARASRKVESAA
jgi:hypothetical protein